MRPTIHSARRRPPTKRELRAQTAERNPRKDIVRLDTHSIRSKALKEHRKAERSLDQLKNQLKRYHEEDVPGFRTWMHRAFGRQLTEQRELILRLEEKRQLLMEVDDYALRCDVSDVEAYKKIIWRRSHPEEAEAEDRRLAEEERKMFGEDEEDDSDLEADLMADFEDEEFDIPENERESFSDFYETMTGKRPPSSAFRGSGGASGHDEKDAKDIKALYRTIVRRLHPDCNRQMTDAMKELWHETQDAYQRHDINALYAVLARCESGDTGLGRHSAVSLIRRLTQQLMKAIRSARRDLGKAKRDTAWNYRDREREPGFGRQIKFDLDDMTRTLKRELDILASAVSDLEWRARKARDTSRPHAQRRNGSRLKQNEFDLPF